MIFQPVLFLLLLTSSAFTQTVIRVDQTILLPAPAEPSLVLYRAGLPPLIVVLGGGLALDTSVTPAVLRAVLPPATPVKPWVVDVILVAAPIVPFLTSRLPSANTPPQVTRNGLVMSPPMDYTFAGNSVTFTAKQMPGVGDVIQIRYQEQ